MRIDRRRFLSLASAAGLTVSIPDRARAALQCTPFNWQGIQQCQAGVQIGNVTTSQQECPNWCWAACIQTIFAVNGYDVDQREIVSRLYPSLRCMTATGVEVAHVTSGRWVDRNRFAFRVRVRSLLDLSIGMANSNAAAQVAAELSENRPVINGALGHATVLTAMTYVRDQFGRGMPQQIIVRDPWPGHPNRRVLSMREAAGTFFIAAVKVT